MANNPLPVISREYKIVLDASHFKGGETGLLMNAQKFWVELTKSVHPAGALAQGNLNAVKKRRRICFYDTPDHVFFQHQHILRERVAEKGGKRELTLKCRHPDRYFAQSSDLRSRHIRSREMKFEEDIKAPFIQLYSHSMTGLLSGRVALEKINHIVRLFPGLSPIIAGHKLNETLVQVNKEKINELVIGEGFLQLGRSGESVAECALIAWYGSQGTNEDPLMIEYSFRYGNKKERYDGQTTMTAFNVFSLMREKMITWLAKENETKTGWIYAEK